MPIASELPSGLHSGIAASRYHADRLTSAPTLSSSIAKTLLGKTPRHAWTAHPRLNPNYEAGDDTKFDLGSVSHELILGRGGGFEVLDFPSWSTKASKEARDVSRKAGMVPLLADQFERAKAMTAAVWEACAQINGCDGWFDPARGEAEVVGLWQDIGGPVCRLMLDWLPSDAPVVVDVKTSGAGLSDGALSRLIDNLGYDLSAGFYLRGLHHLMPHLIGRWRWMWVFVEDDEPHEVRVIEADAEQIGRGHRKAALAIAKWQRAMTTGEWPGYPRQVARVGAPGWAEAQWNEREADDPDFAGAVLLDHHPIPPPAPETMIFGERLLNLRSEAA